MLLKQCSNKLCLAKVLEFYIRSKLAVLRFILAATRSLMTLI